MPPIAIASSQSWVGLGLETTRGTIAAPKFFYPAESPAYTPTITKVDDKGLRGSPVDIYDVVNTTQYSDMSWKGFVYTDTFPELLRMALGSADTVAGTVAPYTHTVGLLNGTAGTEADTQPPSATISFYNGHNTRQMAYSMIDELNIMVNAAGVVEYTAKTTGYIGTVAATNPVPSFSGVRGAPAWDTSVSIGGTLYPTLVDAQIDIKRSTKPIVTANGSAAPYSIWAGPCDVSGKLTLVYRADTLLGEFVAGTQPSLSLTMTNPADSSSLLLQMSRIDWKTGKINLGKEFVEQDFEITAIANTTDAVDGGYANLLTKTTNSISAAY